MFHAFQKIAILEWSHVGETNLMLPWKVSLRPFFSFEIKQDQKTYIFCDFLIIIFQCGVVICKIIQIAIKAWQ